MGTKLMSERLAAGGQVLNVGLSRPAQPLDVLMSSNMGMLRGEVSAQLLHGRGIWSGASMRCIRSRPLTIFEKRFWGLSLSNSLLCRNKGCGCAARMERLLWVSDLSAEAGRVEQPHSIKAGQTLKSVVCRAKRAEECSPEDRAGDLKANLGNGIATKRAKCMSPAIAVGRRVVVGLVASSLLGGTAEAKAEAICQESDAEASCSPVSETLSARRFASTVLGFRGIYGPTDYLLSGGGAALLPSAILLLGVCLVTPAGRELLRSRRPNGARMLHGAALGKASASATVESLTSTSADAYVAVSPTTSYKSDAPVVMDSIQPTLDETRRLLHDFEGLSSDMAAAGVDMAALAGKLRSLQGALDACADPGPRAAVVAEVGAAARGEERRVALCRVLLQDNDSLRLKQPGPELDANTVAWLEQYLERARVGTACNTNGAAVSSGNGASSASASHSSTVEHLERALQGPPGGRLPLVDAQEERQSSSSDSCVSDDASTQEEVASADSSNRAASGMEETFTQAGVVALGEVPSEASPVSSGQSDIGGCRETEESLVGPSPEVLEQVEVVKEAQNGALPSAAVLETPSEAKIAGVGSRKATLDEYRQCLDEKRAADCIAVLERGQRMGLINLKKHVSHQRVLRLCASERDASLSIRFLKLFKAPSLTLLNSVMAVCAQKGDVDRAFDVLKLAQNAGVTPDCPLYTALITTCMKGRRLDLAFKVFHDMEAVGVKPNLYTFAALIHGCGEARQVAKAFGVYSIMLKKNITPDRAVYNSLINACGRSGAVVRAFDVYGDMALQGLKPNAVTLGTLVNACAQAGELERAIEIYAGLIEQGVLPSKEVYTSLVHACSKSGDLAKALAIYADMRAAGMEADEVLFSALIDVAGQSGQLDMALYLLTEMRVAGVPIGVTTYGALIGMFGKAGLIPESERLFEQMQAEGLLPSVAIYNALIGVKGRAGRLPEALALLQDMRERGVKPDTITYASLLRACNKAKEADLALELYYTALAEGIPPFLTACRVLIEICAHQIKTGAAAPSLSASGMGPLAFEVGKQPPRMQWAYRALQVHRATVAAGVRVSVGTFSLLLGCFKLPPVPGPSVTSIWTARSGRISRRPKRAAGQASGEDLFKDDGAGLYSAGAVALYEEVAAKGLVPQCRLTGPSTLDMTYLPPNAAEVCILAVLKRVKLKLAASPRAPMYSVTLKLKTHLEPSPNKEMEGHMIHIASRSGTAVASLLRRLRVHFDGQESSGSITISSASLRRWLRPRPVRPRRGMTLAEQQRAIRLGQPLHGRARSDGRKQPGPKAGSKPDWYPKVAGWQTMEGYGAVYEDEETQEESGAWSEEE